MKSRLLFLAVCLLAAASAQDVRWMWVQGGYWNDEARTIAYSPDSNIYVAGFSSLGSNRAKFAVTCLSSGGQQRWLDTLEGSIDELYCAWSAAVGVDGSVYATGEQVGEGRTSYVAVVNIDTTGARRWVKRYGEAYSAYVTGRQVVCGPDGNVYVAACAGDSERRWLDFSVASITPDGDMRWSYRWPGPTRTDEYAYAIALGANGHLCAVGSVTSPQQTADFTVVDLDTCGSERWTFNLMSPGYDCANCVAVAGDGSVYPAGVFGHSSPDLVVFGLSDTGARRWCYSYDGPARGDDAASAIVCGPDGNIYVAGTSEDSDYWTDMVVVSLDAAGRERWVYRYDTTAAAEEHASALAVSPDGYVYVAGYAVRWYTDSCDFTVVCLDTAGREQWVYRYGTGIGYARACAISLGADRRVYAAGWITMPSKLHEMMVVCLEPASGIAELRETASGWRCATIIRGVLFLPWGENGDCPAANQKSCSKGLSPVFALLDAAGRKVLNLKPGANDVSELAPGVYFVRAAQAQAQAQAIRKVVVQR